MTMGARSSSWKITCSQRPMVFSQKSRRWKYLDIQLKHGVISGLEEPSIGNFRSVVFLSIAAAIILIIACLNFINLTTIQAIKRAKEVGIRKFVGATKSQLLLQYGIEAFTYCTLAGILSILLLTLGLGEFNQLSGKSFQFEQVLTLINVAIFIVGIILISLFSGWYPALLITRIQPMSVLHGQRKVAFSISRRKYRLDQKQLLVAGQYILSIGLILISIVVNTQFGYLQDKDMGFKKENLVAIRLTGEMDNDFKATREAFLSHSAIESVTACYGVPGGVVAGDGAFFPGRLEQEMSSSMIMADHDYIETMGMEIVAGRDFSSELASDVSDAFIINRTASQNLGFANPEEALGQSVRWKMWVQGDTFKVGRVIGVVEDFNFKSLHHEVGNVIIHMNPRDYSYLVLRLQPEQVTDGLTHMKSTFDAFAPTRPFEYEFIDQTFAGFYENEQRTSKLFTLFTILAIFTASIGLYGLVTYSVSNRGREISIRKVLGAETTSIFNMLVSRYMLLAVGCLAVALPLSYFVSGLWLENFAYRVSLNPLVFIVVAFLTLLVTLLTVGLQAWRGAVSNPADKLRTE